MTESPRQRWQRAAPLRVVGIVGLALAVPIGLLVTLQPLRFIIARPVVEDGLDWLHARGWVEWVNWSRFEVLANVAMLVPVALLLTFVLGRRRWWLALALCIAASIGIEVAQGFIPGRDPSGIDIIANSLGAVIGTLIAVGVEELFVRARRASARRREAATGLLA